MPLPNDRQRNINKVSSSVSDILKGGRTMFPYNQRPLGPRRPRNPFFPVQHVNKPSSQIFFDYFKTNDGHWDFDKISQSIGQVNKIVKQADPLVKQMASIVKKVRPK
ncbi:hypothetical protein CQJ30_10260 [Caldibacillus thermoamylovorans]|nr:hypothetical protein CQJ30_10260 [Caldibacillus thermoamylovorans]